MTISCADLDNFFDGELGGEHATTFRAHLGGCEACQRVLHGRMQEAVLIDAAPDVREPDALALRRRRRRRALAAAVSVLGATAVGVVGLVAVGMPPSDSRAPSLQVSLSVEPAGPVKRGKSAHLGDLLRVTARGARHRAIWVYREDGGLVASCPGPTICQTTGDSLDLMLTLSARGTYAVMTLGAASALPAPAATLDLGLEAASSIDGSYQLGHIDVD